MKSNKTFNLRNASSEDVNAIQCGNSILAGRENSNTDCTRVVKMAYPGYAKMLRFSRYYAKI